MFSPYVDTEELKQYLPFMTRLEIKELLEAVEECLLEEQDPAQLTKLINNRNTLEEALNSH